MSSDIISVSGNSSGSLPLPNPLERFASFNCIFTLGLLSYGQIASFSRSDPGIIIAKSGGTVNQQVQTAPEQSQGITGEYFIDDVVIDSIIAPTTKTRHTNATGISFSITEPYSMGLFLQSLAVAAQQEGFSNFNEAPWVLIIEFVGYDDLGNAVTVENTKRYFPLKFTNIDFTVNAGGSQYNVEAIPFNEQALADEIQAIEEDVDLTGITVGDFLGNLQDIINTREQTASESGQKKYQDTYVFGFPQPEQPSSSAGFPFPGGATTQSIFSNLKASSSPSSASGSSGFQNKIAESKISKSSFDSGNQKFGIPEPEQLEDGVFKRGDITLYPEERRINFKKGTRIQEIVEELILLSDYGRSLPFAQPDSEGMKEWFKINVKSWLQAIPDNVNQKGRSPGIYLYEIEIFKYNSSKTNSPTQKTKGIEQLKSKAVKEYNYIYTGKNDDIIGFDLQFNNAFFQSLGFDLGQLGQDQTVGGAGGMAESEQGTVPKVTEAEKSSDAEPANATVEDKPRPSSGANSGGARTYPETAIARAFNDAIISGIDLITVNLEILGDPYYIADEGAGNYDSSPAVLSPNINSDGSISYKSREVDVLLNFRTPIDIGRDGFMKFPELESQQVKQFSGLYQVITVRNSISQNKFTQNLELIRRRNQFGDESSQPGLTEEGTKENELSGETNDSEGNKGVAVPTSHPRASGNLPSGTSSESSYRDNSDRENLGIVDEGPRRIIIRRDSSDF